MPVQTETGNPDLTSADPIRQAAAAVQKPYSAAAADDRPDRNSYSLCFRNCNSGKSKFSYDPLFLGNTAQSWRCRYAVRFFVRLYENDAAGLTPSKEFSCKMTENMQVDALPSAFMILVQDWRRDPFAKITPVLRRSSVPDGTTLMLSSSTPLID